jgi:hypothetical protein
MIPAKGIPAKAIPAHGNKPVEPKKPKSKKAAE